MANLRTFDLNLLRVLDAMLRETSTVRASQRLGLSQPAVSAALGRLRAALNDPLFVRHGQRLVATDFARDLALPLRETLDSIERLLGGPDAFDPATAQHPFKIAGSDFFSELLMPPLAERLGRTAPGVRVQLVDLMPDNSVDVLESDTLDVAVVPRFDFPAWTTWQPLFHSDFTVIARRGHPRLAQAQVVPGDVIPMDLYCDLGHILFSTEGNLAGMADAALARVGRSRRVVMTMPVFFGVCSAVAASDHLALVPGGFAANVSDKLGLDMFQPPMPYPRPVIAMVWHRRLTQAPAHIWLRARIAEILEPLNTGGLPLPDPGLSSPPKPV